MGSRLIERSSSFDLSPREKCRSCGKPLGSTKPVCFTCRTGSRPSFITSFYRDG